MTGDGNETSTRRRHVLECDLCARLSVPLLARGHQREDTVQIPITTDADVVAARQAARELAVAVGFAGTDLTLLATAVSEVARNIVRFTDGGEVVVEVVEDGGRRACRWWPGTPGRASPTSTQAMADGYSTYGGLGTRAAGRAAADGRVRGRIARPIGGPP